MHPMNNHGPHHPHEEAPQFFGPILEYYWHLPSITRAWFSLACLVTALETIDLLSEYDLLFSWDRIQPPFLELWRIITSFTWAGPGKIVDIPVLFALYAMVQSVPSYEMNPHEAGQRSRRQNRHHVQSDCLFAFMCCALLIVGSYLLLTETTILESILQPFGINGSMLLQPLFTRTLEYSILTLDSFRNPDRNVNINFFPVQGRYVPLFHLGFAALMGYRMTEIIHGIVVGTIYLYLIAEDSKVASLLGRKRLVFKPQWLEHLLGEELEALEEENIPLECGANILHRAAANNDLSVILRRLRELETVPPAGIQAAIARFTQKDINDWQPLHEAARGGHIDVLKLLLEIDGDQMTRGNTLKVDVNARTNGDRGCTALWLAEQNHGIDSAVSQFIRNVGGISIGGILAGECDDSEDLSNSSHITSEEESIQDEY